MIICSPRNNDSLLKVSITNINNNDAYISGMYRQVLPHLCKAKYNLLKYQLPYQQQRIRPFCGNDVTQGEMGYVPEHVRICICMYKCVQQMKHEYCIACIHVYRVFVYFRVFVKTTVFSQITNPQNLKTHLPEGNLGPSPNLTILISQNA